MVHIDWQESPSTWTAVVNQVPVCSLKSKDIGGCVASWLNGHLWAAPGHSPKATPQPTRFFSDLNEAKHAVEQHLKAKKNAA